MYKTASLRSVEGKEMVESSLALKNEGESVRLKTKGTAHNHWAPVDTVIQRGRVNNSDTSINI